MSGRIFPIRTLHPCRRLVHSPLARRRAYARARAHTRASGGFSFSPSPFTHIYLFVRPISVNIIAFHHHLLQQQIIIYNYYTVVYHETRYFTRSKSRNSQEDKAIYQVIM